MTAPESPALFGVVLPEKDPELLPIPLNGPYFVPAKQGWSVMKKFHWGRVLTPVKEAEALHDREPFLWPEINLPKELVGQAWAFFAKIYELRKTEAMVDITWSRKHGYRLFCPPQATSGGGVQAKRTLEHYQGQIVGTIHSHCDFGAFHSGTDTHDADGHDGLHITLGHNMKEQPEIATMISVGGVRWNFKPEELWEEPTLEKQNFPWWWIPKVGEYKPEVKKTSTPSTSAGSKYVSPTQAHATKPKGSEATSIVAYTQRGKKIEHPASGTMFEEYTCIDEYLYMHDDEIQDKEKQILADLNEVTDEVAKVLNSLGLDFDYTLSPQVETTTRRLSEDDMIPEEIRGWF